MTYVVAEPCVNCRYTDCALVCPVEAFHLDDDMLVINPETCIDCDACVPGAFDHVHRPKGFARRGRFVTGVV